MIEQIIATDIIDFPIEEVWRKISAFDEFADFHPVVTRSFYLHQTTERVGNIHRMEIPDGFVEEKLMTFDQENHFLEYIIIKSSLPLSHYRAEIKLTPREMNTQTLVHWQAIFSTTHPHPKQFAEEIRENIFVAGISGLAHFLTRAKRQLS